MSMDLQASRAGPGRVVRESPRRDSRRGGQPLARVAADLGGLHLQEAVGASRPLRLRKHLPSGCSGQPQRRSGKTHFGSQQNRQVRRLCNY